MAEPELQQIFAADAAGARRPLRIDPETLRTSVLGILAENVLCSLATTASDGTAHVNAVYFAYTEALELVFLSHPASNHCQNLRRRPEVAVAIYASGQAWTGPDRGIQLFGAAAEAVGAAAAAATRCYAGRFRGFTAWQDALSPGDLGRQYRLYRVEIARLKLLDEPLWGEGVFVQATVARPPRP